MRLIKKAVGIGNGAAVYVPKEYEGRDIVVVLPEEIKNIRERVLSSLIEFMPNIIGVYLFGSYAREEQGINSDIDILVITKEKEEKIKNTLLGMDVRVMTLENVEKSIKNLPVLIMPILNEAKVFLNPFLIEELKKKSIDFKKFKWNFEDIKRIVKIIESFIEVDDEASPSDVYSLVMRIRICYIMECLMNNRNFSNKGVKKLLLDYELKEEKINEFFEIYGKIRENEEVNLKAKKEDVLMLIKIVKDYSKKIENETRKKAKKRY